MKSVLVGFKDEDILAFANIYDSDNSGTISLSELVTRLNSHEAGAKPPISKFPQVVVEDKENIKVLPPRRPSEIPQAGNLKTRLSKFRQAVKGLYTSKVGAIRKNLSLTSRMTKHSSSQDSELVAEVSRNNIYKTFDSLGGSRKLELDKWISIFTRISEYSPTTPSLGSEDLKSLWIECNNGEVDIFVNSLFPPPPSTKELILASKKYGNTESVYKNRIDLCDSGQPLNASYFNFDGEGEGERRIHAPPDTSVPSRINYRYCRTPVSAPSGFNVEDVAKSGRLPVADLELKHVLGFKGDGDSCNLYGVGRKFCMRLRRLWLFLIRKRGGRVFLRIMMMILHV